MDERVNKKTKKCLTDNVKRNVFPPSQVVTPVDCVVLKVLITDGMFVEKDQSMFVLKSPVPSTFVPLQISSEHEKSKYKKILEGYSRVGTFPITDVLLHQNAIKKFDDQDVMKKFQTFRKFDIVVDHSDHLFSSQTSTMKPPGWAKTVKEEWKILDEQLPETIFVRAYESRMNLLRAVIIGPEETPYHHGLFFFDVCFPDNYPHSPPLVRYRSCGFGINPNVYKSGEVCLNLFNTATRKEENLWVPGTSNMLQLLLSIQGLILNPKPYFYEQVNETMTGYVYSYGDWFSLLYNENTMIKSLKTMVYTMNKPPKNFEDLVVGHFRKRARDILMACKGYTEGLQVGCLVSGYNNETCSIEFKNDVVSCINPLVDAFNNVGAKEAQEFLHLIEESKAVIDAENKKKKLQEISISHDSGHDWLPWNLIAFRPCPVTKVLVKEGMKVPKGQPLCSYDVTKILHTKDVLPSPPLDEATIKNQLYAKHRLREGIFYMEDLSVDQDDVENNRRHDNAESSSRHRRRKAGFVNAGVLKRFVNFKKFEFVVDHSDHFFPTQISAMNQAQEDDWANKIREEWKILEEHLPETIFVRAYESRMDLLRAVIIGPEGTPYHRVLFFFDICFPANYPNSPPEVHYRSGGLAINPNLDKSGEVCLSLHKKTLWVPGTTTMLQLLVSIRNQFLIKKPLFNSASYSMMKGSIYGEHTPKLYNENTMIKSLKTIVYTINKRPKNFEFFVAGYYHYYRRHILIAFSEEKTYSRTCFNDTASMIKPLQGAFAKISGKQKSKRKSTNPSTKLKNKSSPA